MESEFIDHLKILVNKWNGLVDFEIVPIDNPPLNRIIRGSANSAIKVSPNPTNSTITLDFENPDNIPNQIQIINSFDQVVKELSAFQVKLQINVEDLAHGMYYIKTNDQKKSNTTTFIKM